MDGKSTLKRHCSESVLRTKSCTSVLIMGFKNVGKSTVLNQLQKMNTRGDTLDEKRWKSDISIDIKHMEQLQFSEATQFPFKSLRKMAIKATDAFVLVYAVNDEESFDYATKIIGEVIDLKGSDVPLIVVANKTDITPRKVHPIIADCVVTIDYECKHTEACALSGDGMKEVLSGLLGFYGDYTEGANSSRHSLRKKLSSFFRK